MRKGRVLSWVAVTLALLSSPMLRAQNAEPPEVAKYGRADTIVVNGKIVSMDDQGYNTNPGRIYQAMAIKGTRIMALGTNQQMRALANADTKVMDVGGRVVIPGLIESHNHMFGSSKLARNMGIAYPHKGVALSVVAGKDIETTRLKIENTLKDAVTKLQPGDWVHLGISANPQENVRGPLVLEWLDRGELENRKRLDPITPVNPVLVTAGIRAIANTTALDLMRKLWPDFDEFNDGEVNDTHDATESGILGLGPITALDWEIFYRNAPLPTLAEMVRQDWAMAAAYGETMFSSRTYAPRLLDAATYLNRIKQAPVRFQLLIETHRASGDADYARKVYKNLGNLTSLGDDMMWIGGTSQEVWDSFHPLACIGPDLPAPPEIKIREMCREPGNVLFDVVQNALEAGWRHLDVHNVGPEGARRYFWAIENAMKATGMTAADIRKLRPTAEHMTLVGNVPDVIAKYKEYGIIVSVGPQLLSWYPEVIKDYGPAAEPFFQPVKSWLDQGVFVVGQYEGYNAIGGKMLRLIDRNVEWPCSEAGGVCSKVILPDQKLDRVTVLKMWTTWASWYFFKENDLGTLEAGKLADFTVLDKDYFTIPEKEIPNITPQMTVLGGKPTALQGAFASTMGMAPVGYQFPAGVLPWSYGSPSPK